LVAASWQKIDGSPTGHRIASFSAKALTFLWDGDDGESSMETIGAADCREQARDFLRLARIAEPQSWHTSYLLSISRTWKALANQIERREAASAGERASAATRQAIGTPGKYRFS
jgi:hypothetical protein